MSLNLVTFLVSLKDVKYSDNSSGEFVIKNELKLFYKTVSETDNSIQQKESVASEFQNSVNGRDKSMTV